MKLIGNLLSFVLLVLIQVLVLSHIHLFGYATPLLFVYFILRLRRDEPKWSSLIWSFMLGLCVDIFNNTHGLCAASATFMGMLQPYVLSLFTNRETPLDFLPAVKTLGWGKYTIYTTLLLLPFMLIIFTLEAFNFFHPLTWLLSIVSSFILTLILILAIENLRTPRHS